MQVFLTTIPLTLVVNTVYFLDLTKPLGTRDPIDYRKQRGQ